MVFAAVRDGAYNVVLLLHIVTVLVAFAPVATNALLAAQLRGGRGGASPALGLMYRNEHRVNAPALVLAGLLGFGLQGMSGGVYGMGDTWIWLSILLWIALNGVLHAVLLPGEKAVAAGDASGAKRADLGGAIVTVLFVVILVLMIWKPGS